MSENEPIKRFDSKGKWILPVLPVDDATLKFEFNHLFFTYSQADYAWSSANDGSVKKKMK